MMFAINKSSRLQRSNNKMVIGYQFFLFLDCLDILSTAIASLCIT